MKPPFNFARFLPMAARLLGRGRLPTLLFAVAAKGASQGNRLGKLKDDLKLLQALCLAYWRGEYRAISPKALVSVVVDLSGRPYLVYELDPGRERVGDFDTSLIHDFLLAFVNELKLNLHVDCIRGRNAHHMIEAAFKGLGRALDQATQLDPRITGVMSTKGVL